MGMVLKATLSYLDKHASRPSEHEAAAAVAAVKKDQNQHNIGSVSLLLFRALVKNNQVDAVLLFEQSERRGTEAIKRGGKKPHKADDGKGLREGRSHSSLCKSLEIWRGEAEQFMAFTVAKLQFYQGLRRHTRRAQAADLHVLEGAGFTSALSEQWSVSRQHNPPAINNWVYSLNCRGGCVTHLWDRLEEKEVQ